MPKAWSIIDFVLVVLGGFLGAAVFVSVSLLIGNGELLLVLGLVGQYAGHLLVLWLVARAKEDSDLGFSIEGGDFLYLGLGLMLQLVLVFLFLPLSSRLLPEGDAAQQVTESLAALETPAARIVAILVAVVLAPVTEELIFRGVLVRALARLGRWTIIIVSAAVFAAFHLQNLDPSRFLRAAAVVFPQLFIVGAILAWITLRSRRLGPAIFVHSGFNLLAAVVLLLPQELLESVGT